MGRIEEKFKELRKKRKKAFIAFITAGYPSLAVTASLIKEFSKIGVDIIELGVPFSDPMADGPVIQEASQEALKKNTHLADILRMAKSVRKSVDIPLCLMTYYNPVFCYGDSRFVRDAVSAGIDGVIIPDLPPEEGKGFIRLADKGGLDNICFIAPTTSIERMRSISKTARGFIYYVSLTGVTGARKNLPGDLVGSIKTVKRTVKQPVCVGFGVSTGAQVKELSRYADGVIVGSAIVKKIKESIGKPGLVRKVSGFVKSLAT